MEQNCKPLLEERAKKSIYLDIAYGSKSITIDYRINET